MPYANQKEGTGRYMAYVLLVRSGTWVSRGIHAITGDTYTHAAISLDGPTGCRDTGGKYEGPGSCPLSRRKSEAGT